MSAEVTRLIAQHPGDGHLRERLAAGLRDFVERADTLEIFFAQEFLEQRGVFEFGARVLRECLLNTCR